MHNLYSYVYVYVDVYVYVCLFICMYMYTCSCEAHNDDATTIDQFTMQCYVLWLRMDGHARCALMLT